MPNFVVVCCFCCCRCQKLRQMPKFLLVFFCYFCFLLALRKSLLHTFRRLVVRWTIKCVQLSVCTVCVHSTIHTHVHCMQTPLSNYQATVVNDYKVQNSFNMCKKIYFRYSRTSIARSPITRIKSSKFHKSKCP